MRLHLIIWFVLTALATQAAPKHVPGRLLVKFKAGVSENVARGLIAAQGATQTNSIDRIGVRVLRLPENAIPNVLNALRRNPNVEFAETDDVVTPALVPNDVYYSMEWQASWMQLPATWDITTGSSNVIIAILDSGIDGSHPDLNGLLVPGYNLYDNNTNTTDLTGHGTVVAGTACAHGNNSIGVAAVTWTCRLMPVKITDSVGGGTSYSLIAAGMVYAATNGAKVANASFTIAGTNSTLRTAAEYLATQGGVFVGSSGNDNSFDSSPDEPSILRIGASGVNDALVTNSSTGNNLDLVAPGVLIITTSRGGNYGFGTGTSASAAIVSGVLGLMFSVNPALTPAQARSNLFSTAVDLGTAGWDSTYGWGRVNAYAAVTASFPTNYYFVATNGNDTTGDGSFGNPWLTIYRATRNGGEFRVAGDTVYIRGGLYADSGNAIDLGTGVGNSGSNGAPITIKAYPGETVIVTGMNQRDSVIGFPVNLKGKARFTFDGIIYSNNYAGMSFTSCTNIILTNCIFTKMPDDAGVGPDGSGTNYSAGCVVFKTHSLSNIVTHCTVTNWGVTFLNGGGSWQTAGSPLIIGQEDLTTNVPCYYNLVENCTFAHCGHDLLGANAAYCVIRSNLFYNDAWMATNETAGYLLYGLTPRSAPNPIGRWGARCHKTGPGNNDFTDVADGNVGNTADCRTVWENNSLFYGAIPVDSNDAAGFGIASRCGIYRRNTIAFCASSGIYFEHSGSALRTPTADTNNPAYFHSETVDTSYGTNCAMSTLNSIYNNVIYGCGTVWRYGWPLRGGAQAWSPVHGVSANGDEDSCINNWMVNNILWYNSPSNVNAVVKSYTFGGQTWHTAIIKTNWDGDYPLPSPKFVSTNGMGFVYNSANLPNFHLQAGSPCIDAGTWLTIATGTSNASTVLTVSNSLYFSDGNHMVTGDVIQLQGQTSTATVLANDWTNNVLTLSAPLSWTNGQGVALTYIGSAPDMGAFESEYSPPPPEPPAVAAPSALKVREAISTGQLRTN